MRGTQSGGKKSQEFRFQRAELKYTDVYIPERRN